MPPCSWIAFCPTKRPGLRHLHFRRGHAAPARDGIAGLLVERHRRHVGHRARELDFDEHLGHAVLQRLERADRHAELLALFGVLHRRFEHQAHQPEPFRAQRRRRVIERAIQQREAAAERADELRRVDAHAVEPHVRDVVAVF